MSEDVGLERIVRELAIGYARIMDDRCFEQLEEIMVDEVVVAAPEFECVGLADFREQLQILHNYSATMHLVGNQFGQWSDGRYEGETYCVASHIYEKDGVGRKWEVGIRYRDSIIPAGGGYKYCRRYLDVLWQEDRALQD